MTAQKVAMVWKVEFGVTKYLVEFNRRYPGDSTFSVNKCEGKCFTLDAAWKTASRLNNGLDAGTPKKYGYGVAW